MDDKLIKERLHFKRITKQISNYKTKHGTLRPPGWPFDSRDEEITHLFAELSLCGRRITRIVAEKTEHSQEQTT